MFETTAEVAQNKYLCRLDTVASSFGLFGCYIQYTPTAAEQASAQQAQKVLPNNVASLQYTPQPMVYFVFGLDKEYILRGNLDPSKLRHDRIMDSGYLHMRANSILLTNCEPFSTHQSIVGLCRDLEFIKNIYGDLNRKIPEKVYATALRLMKMHYSNACNFGLKQRERIVYKEGLIRCINRNEREIDPSLSPRSKLKFDLNGYYDVSYSKIHNWFKRIFSKNPNRVSLQQLYNENLALGSVTFRIKYLKPILREMKKHKEILYWIAPIHGMKFHVPKGQGFGKNKKDNDLRNVTMAFGDNDSREVYDLVGHYVCPAAYQTNRQEMQDKYSALCKVSVPESEYDNFVSLCKANNVEFCMDIKENQTYDGNDVFIVPYKNADMLNAILTRLGREAEEFHICNPEHLLQRAEEPDLNLPAIDLEAVLKENAKTEGERINEEIAKKYPDAEILYSSWDHPDQTR